ncbi:MAG TPA: toll/interleukin-1 receptor domain-containing protein [Ktedonobacteraceae bacterium]|nr:toll/interleukin-1 receptor domain-containing protein [Ktedonobacteraceae bacterium]
MTIQQRQQILRILSEKPARDPLQTLSKEELLAHMAMVWDDLRTEIGYLEEKGYIIVKRRYLGTRIFDSFYLTPHGIDWIESQVLPSPDISSSREDAIAPFEPSQQTKSALTLFFSYAQEDILLLKELEKHLSMLKHHGLINVWYDREISAGMEWRTQIDAYLNAAQIILLLVSPDFMASDYCYSIEMKRAMERHERDEARVIPILLRSVSCEGAPFARLQMLPINGKPITSWSNPDEAFKEVTQSISQAVREIASTSTHFPPSGSDE